MAMELDTYWEVTRRRTLTGTMVCSWCTDFALLYIFPKDLSPWHNLSKINAEPWSDQAPGFKTPAGGS